MKPGDVKRAAVLLEAHEGLQGLFDALQPEKITEETSVAINVGTYYQGGGEIKAQILVDPKTAGQLLEDVETTITSALLDLGISIDE